MKTISGKLMTAHPISLSKAAKYISDFASFDNNGASDAVSIYLQRASEAFNSLVKFHKDLKSREKPGIERDGSDVNVGNGIQRLQKSNRKDKNLIKKKGEGEDREDAKKIEIEEVKGDRTKKRKSGELEGEKEPSSAEQSSKKKRKKRKIEAMD